MRGRRPGWGQHGYAKEHEPLCRQEGGNPAMARAAQHVTGADEERTRRDEERYGTRLLVILLTATLFSVMNSTMVNVALPRFMQDYHIDLSVSIWLYTGYVLPYAVAQPL